jgi:hypothetical protein
MGTSGRSSSPAGFTQEFKARLFLFAACLWPLWVLALFGASSNPTIDDSTGALVGPSKIMHSNARTTNLRNLMDRVDIMGYGPTHPRVAFVVVGSDENGDNDDAEALKSTVESVFRNTDLNRVFLICAVLDGQDEISNKELVSDLVQMDQGSVPHWHGLRPDIHIGGLSKNTDTTVDEDPHGRKIHTMFHPERVGIAAARSEAVEFVQLLAQKHIEAGLKTPEEDLILVFLQAGAQLTEHTWLQAVTHALIVPPPLLRGDEDVALKLANAVSLRLEDPGKVTSFDEKLMPMLQASAKAEDINSSSGASYGTPALNGAGIALRLDTFVALPAQDSSLMDPWPANLELALNLWLCADGIDILQDAQITTTNSWMESLPTVPLDPLLAARFAAVWMDDAMQQRFFQAYSSQITRLEWDTKIQHVKQSPTFPKGDIAKRCRPFEWYAQEVNTHLGKVLDQTKWEEHTHAISETRGTVKKAEMAQVAADIVDHEAKHQAAAHPNPNIRANLQAEEQRKAEQAARDIKEHDVNHEEHHEPPPEEQQPVAAVVAAAAVLKTGERRKPKIPLRQENLEIVQKATPVDITFIPMDGGHTDHPHMGAKDEEGNWGYVHDEKALRNNPPPFTLDEDYEREACSLRDNNFKMMTQRVAVDTEYERKQNEAGVKRDKIFCLVYTTESGHSRIPNIRETWGPKCDGFMVGSTKTDKSLGTVEIPHEGPEECKIRSLCCNELSSRSEHLTPPFRDILFVHI